MWPIDLKYTAAEHQQLINGEKPCDFLLCCIDFTPPLFHISSWSNERGIVGEMVFAAHSQFKHTDKECLHAVEREIQS